jgi:CHAD domain-containing protein
MKMTPLTKYLTYQLYHAIQLVPKLSKESDIEHLHQFRVSIRRSRSLMRLYTPQQYAPQEVLRSIVQKTNILRELDVFIVSVDPYAYPELTLLLHNYRNEQFDALLTEEFRTNTFKALHKLYDIVSESNPAIDNSHLVETAETYYKELLSEYRQVKSNASEELLHELRIRFKIARYALEFLMHSGLHNEKMKIKECKAIQDHLGAVQDAANQLNFLKAFCKSHKIDECFVLLKERKKELKSLKKLTNSNQ